MPRSSEYTCAINVSLEELGAKKICSEVSQKKFSVDSVKTSINEGT